MYVVLFIYAFFITNFFKNFKMKSFYFGLNNIKLLLVLLCLLCLNTAFAQSPTGGTGSWSMTFDDEFNNTSLDQTKWRANWGNGAGGSWTNVSWSWEIMDANQLKFPGDGSLHIRGEYINGYWYSGAIQTSATFTQTYGFYEARLKMNNSYGFLNAFWLAADGTWPPEIDIVEKIGSEPTTAHYTQHYDVNNNSIANTYVGPDLAAAFHVYGCEWNSTQIKYYFDGILVATQQTKDVGDGHAAKIPMFVLLNIHIGNSWAGYPVATQPSADMTVDYVRVWTNTGVSVPVTGVTVSPTSASVTVGSIQQLTATVSPGNASNKNVTWSSSNTSVATVSSTGVVTGVGAGTATITVTTQDQIKTATCAVTVTPPPAGWNKVDDASASIAYTANWALYTGNGGYQNTEHYVEVVGQTATYTFTGTQVRFYGFKRNDLGNAQILIDNVVVATVDCYAATMAVNQMLYESAALSNAQHTIKINCVGTKNASSSGFEVIVDAFEYYTGTQTTVPVTGVSVSPTTASIAVGATQTLTTTVAPSNATNKSVSWSSSNTGVATVSSSGLVTGVAAGTATIMVTTADGTKTATCAVTVTAITITWTKIDDANASVVYSAGWSKYIGNSGYQNTEHYTFGSGNSATLTFTGTKSRFYGFKRNDLGFADIYVDGTKVASVDCYAVSQSVNVMLYETAVLTSGQHTIAVKCTSAKNASSNNTQMIIDAFEYTASALKSASVNTEVASIVSSGLSVDVFPNPLTEQSVLKIIAPDASDVNIRITDISGRIVFANKIRVSGESSLPLTLDGLGKGVYILQVQQGNQIVTKRILK